jgi:membrane carboxypeptidase/penicillin-binding protein
MRRRIIRRTLTVIPIVLLAYLGSAALWAAASVDELVAAYPAAGAPLSPRQRDILLKVEDPTFLEHHGLSLADGQGSTTITSSMARDVLLFHAELPGARGLVQRFYRAVFACCKKIDIGRDAMALVLDAKVSKQRQLELFSAQIYMGTLAGIQVRGLGQASLGYFGKPLAQLGEADFVSLVAMIKGPNQFHPVSQPQAFALRRTRVAAVVSGACRPSGWFDTSYEGC